MQVTFADVQDARNIVRDFAFCTPALRSDKVDRLVNAQVFFKCENLQNTGSFKIRGASYALSTLTPNQKKAGVVAFSSGNHAQAMACAAAIMGIPATIVMPEDAPQIKIQRTREFGATVRLYDRDAEDREAIAKQLREEQNLTLIPPYNHPKVMAGQGTLVSELFEQVGALDYLFVCVGGGGLISGCAIASSALMPTCQVFGVEPVTCNDAQQSLRSGELVTLRNPFSIADGARTERLGDLTFPIMQQYVKDIVTVSDDQIRDQMLFFANEMHLFVEPTGCLAATAVLQRSVAFEPGAKIGVVVTGGNIDMGRFTTLSTVQ